MSEHKPGDVVAIRAEVIATGGRVFSDDDPRAPLNGRIWVVVGGARSSVLRGDIAPWPDAVRLEEATRLLRLVNSHTRWCAVHKAGGDCDCPYREVRAFLAALPGREGEVRADSTEYRSAGQDG